MNLLLSVSGGGGAFICFFFILLTTKRPFHPPASTECFSRVVVDRQSKVRIKIEFDGDSSRRDPQIKLTREEWKNVDACCTEDRIVAPLSVCLSTVYLCPSLLLHPTGRSSDLHVNDCLINRNHIRLCLDINLLGEKGNWLDKTAILSTAGVHLSILNCEKPEQQNHSSRVFKF